MKGPFYYQTSGLWLNVNHSTTLCGRCGFRYIFVVQVNTRQIALLSHGAEGLAVWRAAGLNRHYGNKLSLI
jgi:hypothetical protein